MDIQDIEKVALATILVYPYLLEESDETITAEDFINAQNKVIASSVFTLLHEGIDVGITTVYHNLKINKLHELIDLNYLKELPRHAQPSEDILSAFKSYSIVSKVNIITRDYYLQSKDGAVSGMALLNNLLSELDNLQNLSGNDKEIYTLREASEEALDAAINQKSRAENIATTGYTKFDNAAGGRAAGEVLLICGRPGTGKSVTAAQGAHHDAMCGIPSAIVSYEMLAKQYGKRVVTQNTGVSAKKFRVGDMLPEEVFTIRREIRLDANMRIVEPKTTSEKHLFVILKRLITMGVRSFYIDYLQLIDFDGAAKARGRTRDEEIGSFTRKLKAFTLKNNLFMTLYSSLNRAVETRGGMKKPELADAKGSGDIEADVDMVWGLWRGEMYGITEDESGESIIGKTLIIKLKSRDVPFDDFYLYWDKKNEKFVNSLNEIEEKTETDDNTYF